MSARPLYRWHEPAFRTQYAELKERTAAAGQLLPGTTGTLTKRSPNPGGQEYWYRVYYNVPGRQSEQFVGSVHEEGAYAAMRERMALADWMQAQVIALRKLGYQVADKKMARVLVELHNRGAFAAGLVMVGTLAYIAWLNELGAKAISSSTQDIDLGRRQPLKLAVPLPFLKTFADTGLPFYAVPNMPSVGASTSVKLPGADQLRVDLLAPGATLGATVPVPEMKWHAQAVPYYDFMLADAEPAAMLAGGQCVPVRLPQPARMVWHKLYASTQRTGQREKAAKDRHQATILAAILVDDQPGALELTWRSAPAAMRKKIVPLRAALLLQLAPHPHARATIAALLR
ncbi:MAG: hypothetical protein E6H74_07695 [Betaproteobacteria bacterium]|nr:MAG: hypothetical protein E6H74_07695 [Betaproteobacteria bacterium]